MKARWARLLAVVSLATVPVLATSPARAEECLPLDVTCIADEVAGEGEEVVEDVVEAVTVDPVVGVIIDDVGEILDGGVQVPPPGDGGGDTDGGGHRGGGDGSGGPEGEAGSLVPSLGGLRGSRLSSIASEPGPAAIVAAPDQPQHLATAVAAAVRSLLVVLVLLGVAIGFVLIQNGLDRRDPRLALAPTESDVVHFA